MMAAETRVEIQEQQQRTLSATGKQKETRRSGEGGGQGGGSKREQGRSQRKERKEKRAVRRSVDGNAQECAGEKRWGGGMARTARERTVEQAEHTNRKAVKVQAR